MLLPVAEPLLAAGMFTFVFARFIAGMYFRPLVQRRWEARLEKVRAGLTAELREDDEDDDVTITPEMYEEPWSAEQAVSRDAENAPRLRDYSWLKAQ